jgi:hypothetical protein
MSTLTKFEMYKILRTTSFMDCQAKQIEMRKSKNDVSVLRGCRMEKLKYMMESKYITNRAYNNFIEYIRRKSNSNHEWLINYITDVYVLVADMNQEKDCNEKWEDFMSEKQYKLLESNQQYVIGYMLVDDTQCKDKHHYIKFINTRLSGHNIGDLMIRKYVNEIMDNSNVCTNYLYPEIILFSARRYWKKQLKFIFDGAVVAEYDQIYTDGICDKIKQLCNIKMEINWSAMIKMLINEYFGWSDSDDSDDSDE